jgi:hypothetical protein
MVKFVLMFRRNSTVGTDEINPSFGLDKTFEGIDIGIQPTSEGVIT